MTNFLRLILALGVLAAVPPLSSQRALADAKAPVIAVINYAVAIRESKAGQSVREQVDKQRAIYEKEIKAAQTKLEDARQELAQQQAVLSPEAFARKRQEFQQQASELQRTAQSRKRSLDQMQGNGFRIIEDAVREILQELVKERGFDIVMNAGPGAGAIILASKELFITEEVVARLDKKLPKVSVKPTSE